MRFRPCIDIHNGKVKQIVGGSLFDEGDRAKENFVSGLDASFYALLYKERNLTGGHVILLNAETSPFYEATRKQALMALGCFRGGLQLGGGVRPENAAGYLDAGASHVIVTSYVFREGKIAWDNLERLVRETGKERLVLDLSCRKKEGSYYIVTDRWQKFTDTRVTKETLSQLSSCCAEFLVHAVDVEGKASGVEKELAALLGSHAGIPVTYAGGIGSCSDIEDLRNYGKGKLDYTIGSALDLFGGPLSFDALTAGTERK